MVEKVQSIGYINIEEYLCSCLVWLQNYPWMHMLEYTIQSLSQIAFDFIISIACY